ncbi:CPBP family intramembrane metalloprotease [Thermomicrobiaceae bacterium CFH 74404]|uniref:CPBP family intramembrane metalloprotease n=1 Tax=Thermalbibacter longus TaxID=2951981 RepID=A0AA41WEA0_9BACT|nr:CPBP family intramembrane metalloprotease [Thermalbibacter longus]MCM8750472.1 CPBP family intramembrane metalloprotease [Thermalbibacter longus]
MSGQTRAQIAVPAERFLALIEVVAVWASSLALLWAFSRGLPAIDDWQRDVFGQPFLTTLFVFIALPLLLLLATRRSLPAYGLTFAPIARPLEAGCLALAVLGPLSGLAFPLLIALDLSPTGWPGAVVLALCYAASLPVVAYAVRNTQPVEQRAPQARAVTGLVLSLGLALALAALARPHTSLVPAILYRLFVVALAEEVFFRGYVQSRLNESFGRPYRLLGAPCGWGLAIAALFFGLAHALSPAGPFQWGWGLWTAILGVIFGYLREKSGSVLAPTVVHGILIAVAVIAGAG